MLLVLVMKLVNFVSLDFFIIDFGCKGFSGLLNVDCVLWLEMNENVEVFE